MNTVGFAVGSRRSRRAVLLLAVAGCWLPASSADLEAQSKQGEVLGNGLRFLHVPAPEAKEVSVALCLPVGWQHDPAGRTGLAEVVRWFLVAAQGDLPDAARMRVEVRPRSTLVWHSGPKSGAVSRLRFIRRILEGSLEVTEDLHAVATGTARLTGDDHAWLLPGSVIRQKAWRTVLEGTPGGRQSLGIPDEIGRVDREGLRDRLANCYGCAGSSLVVLGDPGEGFVELRSGIVALARTVEAPEAVVHDSAPASKADSIHDRVDGAYVSVAWPALSPHHEDYLAFLIAMLVVRDEAAREFGRYRGMEWKARFPYVAFRPWDEDLLVRINRRGPNHRPAKRPRREIENLLTRLRETGLREASLPGLQREVAKTLETPPYTSSTGPFLSVRSRYLATALCLGWPLDLAGRAMKVRVEDVNRVLRASLREDRLHWFVLRPSPRSDPRMQGVAGSLRRRGL